MAIYVVRGSLTSGAAATKDYLTIAPASNIPIKIKGITLGNQSATAAQGTAWQLIQATSAASGTSFTAIPVDQVLATTANATCLSTITANLAGTVTILDEFAFDVVASYTKWFPPGLEPRVKNTNIFGVRKVVGADTTTWSITVYFEE